MIRSKTLTNRDLIRRHRLFLTKKKSKKIKLKRNQKEIKAKYG